MTDLLNSVNVIATSGVKFGTGSTLVTLAASVSTGRTYTISDAGSNANFMMDTGGVMQITNTPSTVGYVLTGVTSTTSSWQASTVGINSELLTLSSSSGTQVGLTLAKNYTEITVNSGVTPLGYVNWIAKMSGVSSSTNYGYSISVDSQNNTYVAGQFTSSTLTPYSSTGSAFGTTVANAGGSNPNTFITKYNDRGIVQWILAIKQTTAPSSGITSLTSICVSAKTGNIYIAGPYAASLLMFYNSDGTVFTTLAAPTYTSTYLACYNSSGFGLWVTYLSGTPEVVDTQQQCVAVNPNTETIYVATTASSLASGAGSFTMYNSNGTTFASRTVGGAIADAIYAAYNSSGFGLWLSAASDTATGSSQRTCPSVAVNQTTGNVYFTGDYYGTPVIFYNPGGASSGITLTLLGTLAQYLVAYNSLGNAIWASKIDHSGAFPNLGGGTPMAVCVNNTNGYIYIGSTWQTGTLTLYNSTGSSSGISITSPGSSNTIIAAYNSAGTAQWGTQIGYTSGTQQLFSTVTNSVTGNLYAIGTFTSSAVIYSSGGASFKTLSTGSTYMAAYTSAGVAFWGTSCSGSGYGAWLNPNLGTLHVAGYFGSTASFYNSDGTTYGTTLSAIGSDDVYVAVYDNLVTNYQLPNTGSDPTTKTLLFQNNATVQGVIIVLPQGNSMYSKTGQVVYRLYFTTTGNKVALTWTNSAWTIQGNLNVPVITA